MSLLMWGIFYMKNKQTNIVKIDGMKMNPKDIYPGTNLTVMQVIDRRKIIEDYHKRRNKFNG